MRWTQLDPSGQDPGYVFAGDDPANEEDLSGTNFLSTAFDLAHYVAGTTLAYINGEAVGGALGGALGCGAGFLFGGPGGCLAGGIILADEGATVLGTANAVHYALTGKDPIEY
jgi:hypothetical protein